MVGEVLSDAGRVQDSLDAVLAQVVSRTDAGEHKYLGRSDGACAEDDLFCLDYERLIIGDRLDACRPGTFFSGVEEQPLDGNVGPDGQIEPVARRAPGIQWKWTSGCPRDYSAVSGPTPAVPGAL